MNEGNRLVYREVIIKNYGQELIDQLEVASKCSSKRSVFEYQAMEKEFKRIAQEIAKAKGLTI